MLVIIFFIFGCHDKLNNECFKGKISQEVESYDRKKKLIGAMCGNVVEARREEKEEELTCCGEPMVKVEEEPKEVVVAAESKVTNN